jgi:hypothetical protein
LLLRRIKDNRFLYVPIVIGTVCLGLISFVEGIEKAGQLFGLGQSRVTYDSNIKEAIISTAKKVDFFLLKIERSDKEVFLPNVENDFLDVEADLKWIFMRNEIQPLNDAAVAVADHQRHQWNRVREQLER